MCRFMRRVCELQGILKETIEKMQAQGEIDLVTFTSASTVRGFVQALPGSRYCQNTGSLHWRTDCSRGKKIWDADTDFKGGIRSKHGVKDFGAGRKLGRRT